MSRNPKLVPESMQRLLKHEHWWQWVSWPSLLMKKMVLTKGMEMFYNPGLSLKRWYNFLIAESGWKWPRDTSHQSTSHGRLTCSGGMKTTLLATSPYPQEGKYGAKSCQIQQSKYALGIPGAAPTADPVFACPCITHTKGTVRTDLTSAVTWLSLQGFNRCPVELQKQMFYTHHSDIFFPAFGNQKSQIEALTLKDRAWPQKGRIQDNWWFLTAPVPKVPLYFFLDILSRWV